MNSYEIIVFLVVVSAIFAYLNQRYIRLPFVIGLFLLSTILSLFVLSTKIWGISYFEQIRDLVIQIDFSRFIVQIMLSFLLFAGSLHLDWALMRQQWQQISVFSLLGVLISTAVVAGLFQWTCGWVGLQVPFIYCLLMGALISPTDPIAVLGILTKANIPKQVEMTIVGESLFNDGIGVVVFASLLPMLQTPDIGFDFLRFGQLFIQEAIGGVVLGLGLAWLLHFLVRSIDHYETEVLMTLAFVMGGYQICSLLHVSGPLAMVVMGLFIGNYRREDLLSDITEAYVSKFWELIDVILNAVLFIMIALILVVIDFKEAYWKVGLLTIPIVLVARFFTIYIPKILFKSILNLDAREAKLLVWGGLRGGLSIALVLSLPDNEWRQLMLIATYFCVVFSILVQGLSIERLVSRLYNEK